jgi:hypothetical protein
MDAIWSSVQSFPTDILLVRLHLLAMGEQSAPDGKSVRSAVGNTFRGFQLSAFAASQVDPRSCKILA